MRYKSLMRIAGAGLGLLALPASAEVTRLGHGHYICEAEAGRITTIDVSDFFAGDTLAARIRFLEANPDSRWGTTAGLGFRLDSGEMASMLVMAPADDADRLWVGLKAPGSNEFVAMESVRRASTVEITATMARGAIFARVGNQRGQIRVDDAELAGRAVTCTSGRFEIELTLRPRPPRRH